MMDPYLKTDELASRLLNELIVGRPQVEWRDGFSTREDVTPVPSTAGEKELKILVSRGWISEPDLSGFVTILPVGYAADALWSAKQMPQPVPHSLTISSIERPNPGDICARYLVDSETSGRYLVISIESSPEDPFDGEYWVCRFYKNVTNALFSSTPPPEILDLGERGAEAAIHRSIAGLEQLRRKY